MYYIQFDHTCSRRRAALAAAERSGVADRVEVAAAGVAAGAGVAARRRRSAPMRT